ncbi:type IV secretory system conjugative DNA transfer family protein (plasmid) [Microvirga sp. VF16]|nr:type IV secretory system conjugative DNA transfer family protein [Microvirga sp. VF16]
MRNALCDEWQCCLCEPRGTDELAKGGSHIFIVLDLKVLEAHPDLARVVIGAFLNAPYKRKGKSAGRTLFLLDEVARLGLVRRVLRLASALSPVA